MLFRSRKHGSIIAVIILFAGICAATPTIQAYGVFDVTFYNTGDSDGVRTSEQDWTIQQMSDVEASIYAWQSHISNVPGRQIKMSLFWTEMDTATSTNILGGSASYRVGNGSQIWNLGEYVWKEGLDPGLSANCDTFIQYDVTAAGLSWNFGANAPASNTIDFRSVITHEIGHSLGWDSTYDSDPRYDDWGWMYVSYPNGNYYGLTDWDKNLVDSSGNRALSGSTGTPANFNQTDNPIFFDGANAVALYGDLVPIYAPETFASGSSLVHLNEAELGNLLMSPFTAAGQMVREVSELEWAMMADMGWTIIPEPASVLLLLCGFGIIRKTTLK